MLSNLLGQIDWPAAFICIAFIIGASIAYAAWINRTPLEIQNKKLDNEHTEKLAQWESKGKALVYKDQD